MNWPSLEAFLQMGGYALYVWGSYAVTFGVLTLETLLAVRRHRRAVAAQEAA